jgi:hypothetical protein
MCAMASQITSMSLDSVCRGNFSANRFAAKEFYWQ